MVVGNRNLAAVAAVTNATNAPLDYLIVAELANFSIGTTLHIKWKNLEGKEL